MKWEKFEITRDNGEIAQAQAPLIISASRSTDIPAWYADWFFNRLKIGYSAWINPFNDTKSYVSYEKTKFIVFWSKNPRPLIPYLDYLKERNIGCYIQYTLNDYENEGLEKNVPALQYRIDTFKMLVDKLGKGSVIWRFDPLILTNNINIDTLIDKIGYVGSQLEGYTEKMVFSYADIAPYKRVKNNLEANHINYREWDYNMMNNFAEKLSSLNKAWGYTLATCGEKVDHSLYGIEHNRCIDDRLIARLAYNDKELMDFLGIEIIENPVDGNNVLKLDNGKYAVFTKNNKDKGQRPLCGCIVSKDIGQYNTCPHLCEYCYANSSKAMAIKNYNIHMSNPNSETIIGI